MPYPVEPWPFWMDGLLAKSADRSTGADEESLAQHTWRVLARLADLYRLRPTLAEQVGQPRLWQRLFCACFLHDAGKIATGFQAVLRGDLKQWPHRHEVLSLGLVDWLFPAGHTDRLWIIATIASHHKEAGALYDLYLAKNDTARQALDDLVNGIDQQAIEGMWRWIGECSTAWIAALGLADVVEPATVPPLSKATAALHRDAIRQALGEFVAFSDDIADCPAWGEREYAGLFYRGLMLAADHTASSTAAQGEAVRPLTITRACARGDIEESALRDHQLAAAAAGRGSAILVAPTGSGKTEAALLWAARQAEHGPYPPRLFYTLPYQASMNAMYARLVERHFSAQEVGLQHSRAVQSLYYDLLHGDDTTPSSALESARIKRQLADLGLTPVRVFSPYQMLRAAYALKGFEASLVDYHGGLFVMDEVHAYEPDRLALVIELMRWLAERFAARFFIMTATLPPTVERALREALPICETLRATPRAYAEAQRHTLHLLDGDIFSADALDRICADAERGAPVLVCLDTVGRAMAMRDALTERLPALAAEGRIVLAHGRFNARDRAAKEAVINQATGTRSGERCPVIVVATQVIEVSLDINLDVLYSDPAPLEAVLQRAGRVNRGQPPGSPLKPVYVFRQPDDGLKVYRADLVQAGLAALERIDGLPLEESRIADLLAEVYSGPVEAAWWAEYRRSAEEFRQAVLDSLRPFHSAEGDLATNFFRLFDGIEVLPLDLEPEYDRLRRRGRRVEASSLLVPLTYRQYKALERAGAAWVAHPAWGGRRWMVDAPYDSESGLDVAFVLAQARNQPEVEDY